MKKILIGICGIGYGHSMRQKPIIEWLLKEKCDICLVTTNTSNEFYHKNFPELKVINVEVPWITTNNKGIDIKECLNNEYNIGCNFFNSTFSAYKEITDYFNGLPDFIITDYEPNVAWFSYAFNIPLICLEQQSKYLGYITRDFEELGREEEIARLRFFFPYADYRLTTSFFNLKDGKDDRYNVEILPPVISNEVIEAQKYINREKNIITVYFSPYGELTINKEELFDLIENISDYKFEVFSKDEIITNKNYNNITFNKFSRENFLKSLSGAKAIISTAGHQLISEAIVLNKPMLLIPFNTYEQNYNAFVVSNNNMGMIMKSPDLETINNFIKNNDMLYNNIIKYKEKNNEFYNKDNIYTRLINIIKGD